ncbi:VOC family protein [Actinophytocola sp.]|uniref:VOC family protein n=1 Tax=Actinophytocola sp. TaxID=1872138 RepID=UPI002ED03DC1
MARPVHFEIHATDPELVKAFYEKVFGWKFDRWGEIPYWVITTGDGPGIDGGLTPRSGPRPAPDAPVSSFVNTIGVDDLDATLENILRNGGTIALEKQAVPTVGWLAYCKDTDGNLFGVLQPDTAAG